MATAEISALITRLTEARATLDHVLDHVGDQWDVQVYSDGAQWTALQVLRHLAISDQAISNNIKIIAGGQEAIPADFDLERYNRRSVEKNSTMTVEAARAQLNTTRAAFLEWLGTLDDASLAKEGRHPMFQVISVRDHLKIMGRHEANHAHEIAAVCTLPDLPKTTGQP